MTRLTRLTRMILLALFFALTPSVSAAVDLTIIERNIVKQPVYTTQSPKYFLVALGAEAKTRVWIVIDGLTLYVDRNGDDDLTEAGERVDGAEGVFKIGELFDPDTKRTHTELIVYIDRRIPTSAGTSYISPFQMTGRVRGKYVFTAITKPADQASQAPMVHLDGPLRARAFGGGFRTVFADREEKFSVQFYGPGDRAAIYVEYDGVPEGIYPEAEFVYPANSDGSKPIKQRLVIKQRC